MQALWRSEKLSRFIPTSNVMVTCLSLLLLCHKCFRIKKCLGISHAWGWTQIFCLSPGLYRNLTLSELQIVGISFYVGFSDIRKETFFFISP